MTFVSELNNLITVFAQFIFPSIWLELDIYQGRKNQAMDSHTKRLVPYPMTDLTDLISNKSAGVNTALLSTSAAMEFQGEGDSRANSQTSLKSSTTPEKASIT